MAPISTLLILVLMGRTYADDMKAAGATALGVPVWTDPSIASAYNSLTPPVAGSPLAEIDDNLVVQTGARETGAAVHYWTGRIEQDMTWHGTVYVGGDVTIAVGATLTLAAGTEVLFLPYHDDTKGGVDTRRAELIIEGRLNAQAGSIVFRSKQANLVTAHWYGITVKRGGTADVSNATIRDSQHCLYAEDGAVLSMENTVFTHCGGFLRGFLRVGKKVSFGTMAGFISMSGVGTGTEGDDGIGAAAIGYASFFLVGYPLGVYLADRRESSFWMTFIGSFLGWWGATKLVDSPNLSESSEWTALGILLGAPVLASELSRMDAVTGGPKRPKKSQDLWFSMGLVPQPQRGLSVIAMLRF